MRVNRYGPIETASTIAAQKPARSPIVRLPERVSFQQQRQQSQDERQARGPVVHAENFVADAHAPIQQRRFFQIANAIDVERGPVVTGDHLARRFGVNGVGVIEQRRREQPGDVNDRPQQHDHPAIATEVPNSARRWKLLVGRGRAHSRSLIICEGEVARSEAFVCVGHG